MRQTNPGQGRNMAVAALLYDRIGATGARRAVPENSATLLMPDCDPKYRVECDRAERDVI